MERVFDTKVQLLKYKALKAVIERAYAGTLEQALYEIPKEIVPGPKSDMRCCIYKERAVLSERVRMAMGGDPANPNVIETLPVACDECPMVTYFVTPACRGCINHKCMDVCPRGAISIDGRTAKIDADKCVECGRCAKSCPSGRKGMQDRRAENKRRQNGGNRQRQMRHVRRVRLQLSVRSDSG